MELTDKDKFMIKVFLTTLEVVPEMTMEEVEDEKLLAEKVMNKVIEDGVFDDKEKAKEYFKKNFERIWNKVNKQG